MELTREEIQKCIELLEPLMTLLRSMNKNPTTEMWYGYRCLRITCDRLSQEERKLVDLTISGMNNQGFRWGKVDVFCHGTINPNPFIYTKSEQLKREYFSFAFVKNDQWNYFIGGENVLLEELEETNDSIMKLETQLEEQKRKRHKLHISYCENVTNHSARARVIKHHFSNEKCPRDGYATFEVEVYDMYTKEILFRNEFSDYHEMPLLSGDPDTEYCCGIFKLNREVIAWDLYKRRSKTPCEYYQAIVWGIEEYIHNNHLGCGMCE